MCEHLSQAPKWTLESLTRSRCRMLEDYPVRTGWFVAPVLAAGLLVGAGLQPVVRDSAGLVPLSAAVMPLGIIRLRSIWARFKARRSRLPVLLAREQRQLLGLSWREYQWDLVKRSLRRISQEILRPSKTALYGSVLLVAMLFALPSLLRLPPSGADVEGLTVAVWQGQLALAAAALPLLIFVIEHARQDEAVIQKVPEVLIRDTFVYPIIATCLVFALVTPLGLGTLPRFNYAFAYVLFAIALFLTAFAYSRLLYLLGNRARLRKASRELIIERTKASVEENILRRMRASLFINRLEEIGIKYFPSPTLIGSTQGEELGATGWGTVSEDPDFHVLQTLTDQLSTAAPASSEEGGGTPNPLVQDPDSAREVVYVTVLPGDAVEPGDPLMVLDKRHFDQPPEALKQEWTHQINRAFGIG